jgi:hypothetical protein
VDSATIMIDGVPIDPAASYRVTVNSFLADGGDNFFVLTEGTNRLGVEVDLDALVTYFGLNSPVAPGPQDRINRLNWPTTTANERGLPPEVPFSWPLSIVGLLLQRQLQEDPGTT